MSERAQGPAGDDALASLGLAWGRRTYVMGIVNATPDSFSGDGLLRSADPVAAAVAQARAMVAAGADLLDVGGESTRPGAPPVSEVEEIDRVLPVLTALRAAVAVPLSVDTRRGRVAELALAAGADLVNDVAGGADPALLAAAARRGAPVVLMANRRGRGSGEDPVELTLALLREAVERAERAGVPRSRLIVDPGYGFGGPPGVQFALLRRLGEFRALGLPRLVGTSRKSSLSMTLGEDTPAALLMGTAATVALSVAGGADVVRVHDVADMVRVVRISDAVVRGGASAAIDAVNEKGGAP